MTELEKAYIAGFFDGEGSACMGEAQSGFYIRASIGQVHIGVLEWILGVVGGRISRNVQPGNHLSKKAMNRWECSGQQCHDFLVLIRPYLKVKTHTVDMVLETFRNRKDRVARAANILAFKQRNAA